MLALTAKVAASVRTEEAEWFSAEPAKFALLSPLADGADQIVAEAALELGFEVHAILPFGREQYRATLNEAGGQARFDSLVERAARVLELEGAPTAVQEAYVMGARATVAHSDLLIAVWDGEPPRGRGGTAEVVDLALRRGIAVVHVDSQARSPTRLLWSGFDPAVATDAVQDTVKRPFDAEHLRPYLSSVVSPPTDLNERKYARAFAREAMPRWRTRIEYPLLLTAAGVTPFTIETMREAHCAAAIQDEWENFREHCADVPGVTPSLDLLRSAYSWSDQLAGRFAQTYRSGHVFNFVLGGTAVCVGLTANIFSHFLLQFSLAEATIAALILLNTRLGVRNEWHRRWLDYRQLAERLRPMRSLALLAIAAPQPAGTATNPAPIRWTEWYALAVWRAMGCPTGQIGFGRGPELAGAVAARELAPQIAYHRKHADQIALLDHRLERISAALFWITLMVSMAVVLGAAWRPAVVNDYGAWLTLAGAGFPALGTAVFGIRFQGDFGGSAVRSENTANALSEIEAELGRGVPLSRAADLVEQAARLMLTDLDEWRLVNQQHNLDLL
ncbi:MAG: hypothetical protein ABIW33_03220 [Sphingomicrobium sp.]